MNNNGPRMSPCFTPIMLSIDFVTSFTTNFTWTFACKNLSSRINFNGTQTLSKTSHNSSLGTRSNALTRCKKRIYDSWPCCLLFFIAILTVKMLSVHPLPGQTRRHDLDFQQSVAGGRELLLPLSL